MLPRFPLPQRIERLDELAHNLWWSWHPGARQLFRTLDHPRWRLGGHNPVRLLHEANLGTLEAAGNDAAFVALYDSVMSAFDADMAGGGTWFATSHPGLLPGPVAWFSMEFAIHNSLPIYAGGLGILAGDMCKEASDLGLPLVGVGFMYPRGYFHQHISAQGWQEEVYQELDFAAAPIRPVLSPLGHRPLATVELRDRTVSIAVWLVRVGRVNVYLLDTNVDENLPQDRELSAQLYTADREWRLQQEIVLGIGGVRVLRVLGLHPVVWHANEGHTAFMMLERVREGVQKGMGLAEAVRRVRATTVFTTHTPVPAGHDVFPFPLVEKYLGSFWEGLGIDGETFLGLGRQRDGDRAFNMTVLSLRMAGFRNGVSQLHGEVTRKMWRGLGPQPAEDSVPIGHVTNGVHVPTWIAPEMSQLYAKYLGHDWIQRQDDADTWRGVQDIPDDELWTVRQLLKRRLMHIIMERAQERWGQGEANPEQVLAMGALLDHDVLTVGFARRFAEYKRPALIFQDMDRLKRIVGDRWRPVQIVFAGKSHPDDFPGKYLIHQVYTVAKERGFQGRIAFVEDYDMHMAGYLVRGVDLWLNNPRRLQEACGTSGMKASLNGVLHLSVRGGWWHEGYSGANGWAVEDEKDPRDPTDDEQADAQLLYRLLEEEIAPLYYDRGRDGVPHGWISVVKEAVRTVAPRFCARRMLKEYVQQMYVPAARSLGEAGLH